MNYLGSSLIAALSHVGKILLFVLLISPVQAKPPADPETLKIITSIRPLTLLVQDLVRDMPVEVTTLLPANADPHNWAMRISDRQALADADLVVWLGSEFERFLIKPLAVRQPRTQIVLGDLVSLQWPPASDRHGHKHAEGRDMHIWLSPANAAEMQKAVAERLAQLKPEWETLLQQRLHQQVTQLDELRQIIAARLAPYQQQGFLAYHDAYGHFVYAFGLRQLGAVNQSAEQGMSARKLQKLQNRARNAKCLMVEKNAEQEKRTAHTLDLPVSVADGLATDSELQTFGEFLLKITQNFESCFRY